MLHRVSLLACVRLAISVEFNVQAVSQVCCHFLCMEPAVYGIIV